MAREALPRGERPGRWRGDRQRDPLYGDIAAAFTIVDRIGLSVETVGHLFGPNRRPTGQRGAFAYWRVGAVVTNTNAARALVVA
jgi:HK97 family phage major capsid protein